jgi:hypothetical protein
MNVIALKIPKPCTPKAGVTLFVHAGKATLIARLNPPRRRTTFEDKRQTSRPTL